MEDIKKIQYAVLQDSCRKLNEDRYKNDIFIQEIKKEINELNQKVDDIMLVLENITNDTTTYKEAEALMQIV